MKRKTLQALQAIASCTACSLYRHQCPLLDKNYNPQTDVCWVGLSAKPSLEANARPLSEDTRSGAIIGEIERMFPSLGFYRTNLVKCPPMQNDRLRYPTVREMTSCSPNIIKELRLTKPQLVILLGKQVIDFFETMSNMRAPGFDDSFTYAALTTDLVPARMVCVHHPSFVNVYRRKRMVEYTNGIARAISEICNVAPALTAA